MKKFWGISQAVFALAFAALFFAACEATPGYDRVTNLWLEGSKDGYVISSGIIGDGYYTNGYIHYKSFLGYKYLTLNNDENGAAAEFKITGFNLRIEVYEGETLPSDTYLYVYTKTRNLIGEIYITTTDGKPEFTFKKYDDNDWAW